MAQSGLPRGPTHPIAAQTRVPEVLTCRKPIPSHGRIDGPIVDYRLRVDRATVRWPLIERHFDFDAGKLVVIDPDRGSVPTTWLPAARLIRHIQTALTPDNYRSGAGRGLLEPGARGFA
jgi:homospermidine synthase